LLFHLGARVQHRIDGVVGAAVFCPEGIRLHAAWIHVEEKAVALVMKGVKGELDLVVVGRCNGFAPGHVSTDRVRIRIPADPDQVEACRIVAQIDVGSLGAGLAVGRILLDEAADPGHFLCAALRQHALEIGEPGGVEIRGIRIRPAA